MNSATNTAPALRPHGTYTDSSGSSKDCEAGYYCTHREHDRIQCPNGYFTSQTKQTSCQKCPAGKSCTTNGPTSDCTSPQYSPEGYGECFDCPNGHICPNTDGTGITLCELGEYVENNQCKPCPRGKKCPDTYKPIDCEFSSDLATYTDQLQQTKCSPCPAGFKCDSASSTPTECSTGEYSLDGQKDCTQCPSGYKCPSKRFVPIKCPNGFYTTTDRSECKPCAGGQSCVHGQNPSSCVSQQYSLLGMMQCEDCPSGYECPNGSQVKPCPKGFYSASGSRACNECQPGNYCPIKAGEPLTCPIGSKCSVKGLVFPELCEAGTYQKEAGKTSCSSCDKGYYCPLGTGVLGESLKCPRGHYCGGSPLPTRCPAGTYYSDFGATAQSDCKTCPAGFYCPSGSVSPGIICPAGRACPGGTGPDQMLSCTAGTYSEEEGASSLAVCKDCPVGHYCCSGTATDNIGSVCEGGVATPIPCPPGFYQGSTRSQTCQACTAGMSCSKAGLVEPNNVCDYGHECSTKTAYPNSWGPASNWPFEINANIVSAASACLEGQYKEKYDGNCETCPDGHYCFKSTGGDNRKPMKCPSGYYCDGTGSSTSTIDAGFTTYVAPKDKSRQLRIANNNNAKLGTTPWDSFGPKHCLPGTWSNKTELTAAEDCWICPRGSKCTFATNKHDRGDIRGIYDLGMTDEEVVNADYFKQNFFRPGQTESELCDRGCYCEPGTGFGFSKNPGWAGLSSALNVINGILPNDFGQIHEPIFCPPGTYNDELGIGREKDCKNCTQGHYCTGNSGQTDYYRIGTVTPTACSAGYYQPELGRDSVQQCLLCQGGYKCPDDGMADQIPCGKGMYSGDGATVCLPCEPGYYCDDETTSEDDMINNKPCPEGTDCSDGSVDEIPELVKNACPLGYYCLAGDATSDGEPIPCPAGYYGKDEGLTAQFPDPSNGNLRSCTPCPEGQYCPIETDGVPNCAYDVTGSDFNGDKYPCKRYRDCEPGHYCVGGKAQQEMCDRGYYQPFSNQVDKSSCAECISGFYCDEPALPKPVVCPANYFCPPFTDVGVNDEGKENPCPRGTYSTSQNLRTQAECALCPAGHYCPNSPTTSPVECPPGTYCPLGIADPNPRDNCDDCAIICPLGAFCEQKSFLPQPCESGKYTKQEGSTSIFDCSQCEQGFFCSGELMTSGTTVLYGGMSGLCEYGYYCPSGSVRSNGKTANDDSNPCTPGNACDRKSPSESECIAGRYQPNEKSSQCYSCAPGQLCGGNGLSAGTNCPDGHFCKHNLIDGTEKSTECSRGSFMNVSDAWYSDYQIGSPNAADCKLCEIGNYCPDLGMTESELKSCKTGSYCEPGDVNAASECPEGFSCPLGTGDRYQNPCEIGFYQNSKGSEECKPCEPGFVCQSRGMTESTITPCPARYFCPGGTCKIIPVENGDDCENAQECPFGYHCPTQSSAPVQCTEGFYSDRELLDKCIECPAGSYCPADKYPSGYEDCINSENGCVLPCPTGHYCPKGTQSLPRKCPIGSYNPNTGAREESHCLPCPAGYFCPSEGQSEVKPEDEVEAGYYSIEGSTKQNPDNLATIRGTCPEGYYCEKGTQHPVPCYEGTFSDFGAGACQQCRPGKFCPKRGMKQSDLLAGYDCTPEGDLEFYCGGGCINKNPIGESSTCDICPRGSKCENGIKTDCNDGEYQPDEGQKTCIDCPAGYTCDSQTGILTEQNLCAPGGTCPEGSSSSNRNECQVGTFNEYSGMRLQEECIECPPGFDCQAHVNVAVAPTTVCPVGQYCPGGPSQTCDSRAYCPSGLIGPMSCPAGSTCNGRDLLTECGAGNWCYNSQSSQCPAGFYCPAGTKRLFTCGFELDNGNHVGKIPRDPSSPGGTSSSMYCQDCPENSYCPGDGGEYDCLDGFVCAAGTKYPVNDDELCPVGKFCAEGKTQSCLDGTFQPGRGQSECLSCPNSLDCKSGENQPSYCPQGQVCYEGLTSDCAKGYYRESISGQSNDTDCFICPYGFYCGSDGTITPKPCLSGFECLEGSISEKGENPLEGISENPCPENYYCLDGQKYACPAGKLVTSNGSGAISETQCVNCPEGYYCPGTGEKLECQEGYYCNEGTSSLLPENICPVGKKCPAGSTGPVDCDRGTKTIEIGQSDCIACDEGFYCENGSDETPCKVGSFCEAGTLAPEACEATKFSEITQLQTGDQCQSCTRGFQCVGDGQRTQCDDGKNCQNNQGENPPEGCKPGHECSLGYERPCPLGTYKISSSSEPCLPCPEGKYCGQVGLAIAGEGDCADGYYCDDGSNATRPHPFEVTDSKGICPLGHFCVGGVRAQCDLGSYQDQTGQTTCKQCPSGYWCNDPGLESFSGKQCPVGHFCVQSTKSAEKCPAGYYRDKPGARDKTDCAFCEPGFYCEEGQESLDLDCPAGYYCFVGAQMINGEVVPNDDHDGTMIDINGLAYSPVGKCPKGSYCPLGSSMPRPCPAGYSCDQEGLSSVPTTICDAGFYCVGGSSRSSCTEADCDRYIKLCPQGFFCLQGQLPTPCPAGRFGNRKGLKEGSECELCPEGYFCWQGQSEGDLNQCPLGYYCDEGTGDPYTTDSSNQLNNICPRGHYCPNGIKLECPSGTFQPKLGKTSCESCPPGYYCPSNSVSPIECPLGSYCVGNSDQTFPCPAGTLGMVKGLTSLGECAPCPPGKYCLEGVTQPSGECAAGYYCYNAKDEFGQTDLQQNSPCRPGYKCPKGTLVEVECPEGSYQNMAQQSNCMMCPENFYCQGTAVIDPLPCPSGYFCPNYDTNTLQDEPEKLKNLIPIGFGASSYHNFPCPPTYMCPDGTLETMQVCDDGFYTDVYKSISCKKCPSGRTCEGGKVRETCPRGKYCIEGISKDCPEGSYNPNENKELDTDKCTSVQTDECAKEQGLCLKCLKGHICPNKAMTFPTKCKAGTYCEDEGLTAETLAKPCKSGSYCPEATATPIPCPAGTYRQLEGGEQLSDCTSCDAGKYCVGGESKVSGDCEAGYYCIEGAVEATPYNISDVDGARYGHCGPGEKCPDGIQQLTCDDGTYNSQSVQPACKTCLPGKVCENNILSECPPGFYCNKGETKQCPTNTWNPSQHAKRLDHCKTCSKGFTCAVDQENQCDLGEYCVDGVQYRCSAGSYCEQGSGSEYKCPYGNFCPDGSTKTPCPAGEYCAESVAAPDATCGAGYYCELGTSFRQPCQPGSYSTDLSAAVDSTCVPCEAGTFCSKFGMSETTSTDFVDGYTTSVGSAHSATVECPVGSSCQGGVEVVCDTNSYQPSKASPNCRLCENGYTCTSSRERNLCEAGYYCYNGDQIPCADGTFGFNNATGRDSDETCNNCPYGAFCSGNFEDDRKPCEAGFVCDKEGLTTSDGDCPTGSYCPGGGNLGEFNTEECAMGTFRSQPGAKLSTECTACPEGQYCANSGLTDPNGFCLSGYYCDTDNQTVPNPTDKLCGEGKWCNGTEEFLCPRGYYRDRTGGETEDDCMPCPAGRSCAAEGLELSFQDLDLCPEGKYCDGYDVENALTKECPPNHKCPEGSFRPVLCSDGERQQLPSQSTCTLCEAGTMCYQDYDQDTQSNIVIQKSCDPGYYCEQGTGRLGKPCPPGTFREDGNAEVVGDCAPCPPGSYCHMFGQKEVSGQCEEGYFCQAGAKSGKPTSDSGYGGPCTPGHKCVAGSSEPEECRAGTYQPNYYSNECLECEPGYDCDEDGLGSLRNKKCEAGYYCPAGTGGTKDKIPCAEGTYSTAEGLSSQSECIPCPAGKYCATFDSNLDLENLPDCKEGYYCSGGSSKEDPLQPGISNGCWDNESCNISVTETCWDNDGLSEVGGVCLPGFYCPSGTGRPIPCPAGFACPDFKMTDQNYTSYICTAGYYCPTGSRNQESVECPPGHFCPEGSGLPQPCPPGTYGRGGTTAISDAQCEKSPYVAYEGWGNTILDSVDCEPGWSCGIGFTSSRFGKLCPIHHYCINGQEEECPVGTWQPAAGSSSCKDCPKGYFCQGGSDIIACPAGSYCTAGTKDPVPCPPGTYSNSESLDEESQCLKCPAGKFCPGGNEQPEDCSPGYYCGGGATVSDPDESPYFQKIDGETLYYFGNAKCPAGHYCPGGSRQPTPCRPGTYDDSLGDYTQNQCLKVEEGHYIGVEAAYSECGRRNCDRANSEHAELCDDGFYCEAGANTPRPTGRYTGGDLCQRGHKCLDGLSESCPESKYQYNRGQSACLSCPVGYFCEATEVTPQQCPLGAYCEVESKKPELCTVGTFNAITKAVNSSFCVQCLPGSYCNENGMSKGTECPAGLSCEAGLSVDPRGTGRDCVEGHFCEAGSVHGIPCPFGSFSPDSGNTEKEDCDLCTAGEVCDERGLIEPSKNCEAGYFCESGSIDARPTEGACASGHFCEEKSPQEQQCPEGYYIPFPLATECVVCPAGYYCPLEGDNEYPGFPDKIICPHSHFCEEGFSQPKKCPDGTLTTKDAVGLLKSSECKPCPTGKWCQDGEEKGNCDKGYFCLAGASDRRPNGFDFDDLGLILSNSTICSTEVSCAGPCPAGYYCPDEGTKMPLPCDENTYLDKNVRRGVFRNRGAESKDECTPCKAGYWCRPGVADPEPCPVGFYCPEDEFAPLSCPETSFRNEPLGETVDDCKTCDKGYYCSNLGMADQKDFPCKPGYYCPGADKLPIKCPAGTYRNETGGKCGSFEDCQAEIDQGVTDISLGDGCRPCEEGFYCPEYSPYEDTSNDYGRPCPPGKSCPIGSTDDDVECQAGFYCPEKSVYDQRPCYAGYYCPKGSWNQTICEMPFYCPEQTGDPLTCDLGYGAIENEFCSTNRTDEAQCCQLCPAGQYRSNIGQVACEDCPVGYYCPEGTGFEPKTPVICPAGHYCPEGNPEGAPRPCPVGTFSSEEGLGQNMCNLCPTNSYSHLEGQISCRPCGPSSYSEEGAEKCECLGENRSFQYSDGSCICKNGFAYYSIGSDDESEQSRERDCLEIMNEVCDLSEGYVRDASTRNCVLADSVDCTLPCDAYYNAEYGTCFCEQSTVPEQLENCCDSETVRFNRKSGKLHLSTGNSSFVEVTGVFGPAESTVDGDSRVYQFELDQDGYISGMLASDPSSRKRRQAFSDQYQFITNPSLCLSVGEMVIFNIYIDFENRTQSSYPRYQRSNIYNTGKC